MDLEGGIGVWLWQCICTCTDNFIKKNLLIVPMRFKYYRKKKKTNILELSLRCVAHASL
jgi:hypothetical protein